MPGPVKPSAQFITFARVWVPLHGEVAEQAVPSGPDPEWGRIDVVAGHSESTMRILIVMLLSLGLAACATTTPPEIRSGEIYLRHASEEPIDGVRFSTIRTWRPVGDDSVLIEFNRNRHYLFELSPACQSEIRFTQSIRLLTSLPRRVDRFDRIQVGDSVCRIIEIREIDFEAVQADLRALRQEAEPARDEVDSDLIHRDDYSGGT